MATHHRKSFRTEKKIIKYKQNKTFNITNYCIKAGKNKTESKMYSNVLFGIVLNKNCTFFSVSLHCWWVVFRLAPP